MRNRKRIIHAHAICNDCDFEEDYFLTAQKKGREHANKTGYRVVIETGYCQHYNEKKK